MPAAAKQPRGRAPSRKSSAAVRSKPRKQIASLPTAHPLALAPKKIDFIDLTGIDSEAEPATRTVNSHQNKGRLLFPHQTTRPQKTAQPVRGASSNRSLLQPSVSTAPAKMGNIGSKLVAASADPDSLSDEWDLPSSPIERHVASRQAAADTPATCGDAALDAKISHSPAPVVSQTRSSARPRGQPAPGPSAGDVVIDLTGEPSSSDDESDVGRPDTSRPEIPIAAAAAPPPIPPRPVDSPPRPPMPAVQWNDYAALDVHKGISSLAVSVDSSVISVDGGSRYPSSPSDAEVKTSAPGAEVPRLVDEHHLSEPPPERHQSPAVSEASPAQGSSSPDSPRVAKLNAHKSLPRLSFSRILSAEIAPVLSLQEISIVKQELLSDDGEAEETESAKELKDVKEAKEINTKKAEKTKKLTKTREPQLERVVSAYSENGPWEPRGRQTLVGESPRPSVPVQVVSPPTNQSPTTPKNSQVQAQLFDGSPKAPRPAAVIASAIKPSARTPEKRKAQAQLLEMIGLYDSASSNSDDERRRKSELVGGTKYVVDKPAWVNSRKQARRTGIPAIVPTKRRAPSPPRVTKKELLRLGRQAGLKSSWLSPVIGKKSIKLEGRPGVITIGSGRRHNPEVDGVGNLSADLWQDRERKRRLQESRERRDKRQTAVDELLNSMYAVANAAEPGDLAPPSPTEGRSRKAGPQILDPGDAKGGAANTTAAPEGCTKRLRSSDGGRGSLVPAKKPRFSDEREKDDMVKENLAHRVRASTPAPDEWIRRDRRQAPSMPSTHDSDEDKDSSSGGESAVEEHLARRACRAVTPAPDDWIKRFRRQALPVAPSSDTDSDDASAAAVHDDALATRKDIGSGGAAAGHKNKKNGVRSSPAGVSKTQKRKARKQRQKDGNRKRGAAA
ncbi:hypothetical protein GGTG_10389 [Gaeumannomyces tritici R3-111a-1]|uniref:Uncharacterized protein n=1 Tax=Gaeumannomyces tritici (strain R3-111a-1) TaxID=644352 RepID=J3PA63_GAET3|nr:hypothetical protein GGTG_10389 [Gaeumannomyces tritici R3-111a-1]EJT71129.1 hypothetical protein GGTG_10389 [Gaeumannomyces tritici R3-111a-1]